MKLPGFRSKGPGFGISRAYYLSVLSTRATLPSILEVVEPSGASGAVVGFGAPLGAEKTKSDLHRPLERGAYVVASKDRKTVLRLLVLSKEEAGFDPETVVMSPAGPEMSAEVAVRVRSAWSICQTTFESHDPAVYPALRFHLDVNRRLSELAEGVVADPISRRYLLPTQVLSAATTDSHIAAADLVSIQFGRGVGLHAFTLGMQKVTQPEFELFDDEPIAEGKAAMLLLHVCQGVLDGKMVSPGSRVGPRSHQLEVHVGRSDPALWKGTLVQSLRPSSGKSLAEYLATWDGDS